MQQFKPSPESLNSKQHALRTLRYAKTAIGALERIVESGGDQPPAWVLTKIAQAAQALGAAVAYVQYQEKEKSHENG